MTNEEIKRKYDNLYNMMATSKKPEYMHCFGRVMTEMMDWMIVNKKDMAEEYVNRLESIKWKNYLTEIEAKNIVVKMLPKAPWTYDVWEKTMEKYSISIDKWNEYNRYALWAVMNSIYSDSIDTIAEIANTDKNSLTEDKIVKSVYALACDKLFDEDGVYNVRKYFSV